MQTVEKIWLDGQLQPWDDAKIHVLSHAIHYGSAVFEGIRFYETNDSSAIFRLKEHIDRLFFSADAINMNIPFTREDTMKAVIETVRANKIKSGYIRPLVFFGYGKMGLNPAGAKEQLCIAVWPWGSYLGKETVKVKISKYQRLSPKSVISEAKVSGHYINSILASQEVHKEGYDEALLLDYEGNVAEGPGENIFMVKKGKLFTPKRGSILPGITRNSVIQIAEDKGISCEEKTITAKELKKADELFFTGTAAEIQPIGQIDDIIINDGKTGPITQKIKDLFGKIVRGQLDEYKNWLSYT